MAKSAVQDPLEKFRFLISFIGEGEATSQDRCGFFSAQMPKRATNKITYREGDDPDIFSQSAGLSTFEDILLERGVIPYSQNGSALYQWMSANHKPGNVPKGPGVKGNVSTRPSDEASNNYRKDIKITVLDRSGNPAKVYEIYNAFVVNFVPGSDLNAGEDGEKLMESITLAYDDFKEKNPSTGADAATSASLGS